MYTVIKIDTLNKDANSLSFKDVAKQFKKKQAALKYAYARNQLISTQCLAIEYMVFDHIEKQLLKAERVA